MKITKTYLKQLIREELQLESAQNTDPYNLERIKAARKKTEFDKSYTLADEGVEKFYNDILEASFFLNICLLSSATYHVRAANKNQAIVTNISIGIAFTEFLGIVCFHVYLRLKKIKTVVLLWKCLKKKLHCNGPNK